jgi:dihydroorotate dehydrogenase (fumarate)
LVRNLLVGADVVMTTSALLRHGPEYARFLLDELEAWMGRKGFGLVGEFRGLLAVEPGGDETLRERTGYVTELQVSNMNLEGPW